MEQQIIVGQDEIIISEKSERVNINLSEVITNSIFVEKPKIIIELLES